MIDFEDFNAEVFAGHSLVVMCISTHYEGDPCDNTKKFYKWVREMVKNKDTSVLKNLKYTIFGLGDTSYEQFNAMGRYFDKELSTLGGERIYKYGEGNAEKNKTEDDFIDWKMCLWKDMAKYYASNESTEQKLERKISNI